MSRIFNRKQNWKLCGNATRGAAVVSYYLHLLIFRNNSSLRTK